MRELPQPGKPTKEWIQHVETSRPEMDTLAGKLADYGATVKADTSRNVVGELPYIAQWQDGEVKVIIRFLLMDYQTSSDIVLTNMATLPKDRIRQGFGTKALSSLLKWARDDKLNEVRCTQVTNPQSERFLEKNGFKKCPAPNPTNDFVYTLP